MKTRLMQTTALFASALFLNACSKGSSSDSSAATATSAQAFTITQSPTTVVAGGSMMITPSGGTAPYTFALQTGSAGVLAQLSGNYTTLLASSTGLMTTMIISDSAGHSMQYSVVPTTTSATTTGACSGIYTMYLVDGTGQLVLLSDASGNIQGHFTYGNSTAALQGVCANGAISFQNLFSGTSYVGTYTTTTASKVVMQGNMTDVNGEINSWMAY